MNQKPKVKKEFFDTFGRPAKNALALFGITKLNQFTKYSVKELLEIHGVGPKAIKIIGEELKRNKLSFKEK